MAVYDKDISPWLVVAFGLATSMVIVAAGWALKLVCPAIGIMISVAWTGSVIGLSIAPEFQQIATWVVGIGGVGGTVALLVKVNNLVKEEPFQWTVPILTVLNGFLVKLCDEYYNGSAFTWYVMSAIAAFLTLVGSVLYRQTSKWLKVAGFLAHLLIPSIILFGIVLYPVPKGSRSITADIHDVPLSVWGILLATLMVSGILGVMAYYGDQDSFATGVRKQRSYF